MKEILNRYFGLKGDVNYLYFSSFLLFISALSLSHFFSWDLPPTEIWIFFALYAVGQALLEVFCFIFVASILSKWAPRWVYLSFISTSFLFMLLHFTHFIMIRLTDSGLNYIFKFLFGSGLKHLIVGFLALNMSGGMIGIALLSFLGIPLVGIGFYYATLWMIRKKPISMSFRQIVVTIAITGAALVALDLIAYPFLWGASYVKFKKTLPFGTTFISAKADKIQLLSPIPPPRDEKEVFLPALSAKTRPNIYLFVIETFRKDYLNVAPHLSQFGLEHIQLEKTFANSSSTHLSWFSIFHSDFPLYWADMRDTWKKGSVPLQLLKNLDYEIHVYSAADLALFHMDELIFGQNRNLLNTIVEHSNHRDLEPCERDFLCFQSLKNTLKKKGQVHIFFLDSPHSEYSFPQNTSLRYEPISPDIDYLTIGANSEELERVKNRYRNALDYVDGLMGTFFDELKKEGLFDDAIIAITGDHGEEFFEEGALFHGTHLNEVQTAVPILLKLPQNGLKIQTDQMTHIDLFPTLLHSLTKSSELEPLFDGRSIFSKNQSPFRMAFLQNGSNTPVEFVLKSPSAQIKGRIVDASNIELLELKGSLESGMLLPFKK